MPKKSKNFKKTHCPLLYRLCQVTEQAITRAFAEDCHVFQIIR